MTFCLSGGNEHDAPVGRWLLAEGALPEEAKFLLMDRAYEGDEIRRLVAGLGLIPVVPPKRNRKQPWEYDRVLYKRRNEVERCFRRLKGFRRVFTRYDKLDVIYTAFILFALAIEALR